MRVQRGRQWHHLPTAPCPRHPALNPAPSRVAGKHASCSVCGRPAFDAVCVCPTNGTIMSIVRRSFGHPRGLGAEDAGRPPGVRACSSSGLETRSGASAVKTSTRSRVCSPARQSSTRAACVLGRGRASPEMPCAASRETATPLTCGRSPALRPQRWVPPGKGSQTSTPCTSPVFESLIQS